jgi:hypothetical protein
MKRFNLQKAKAGSEVCTKSGKNARILLFDRNSKVFPLVVIINNSKVSCYTENGKFYAARDSDLDLRMK